ncbi:3-oxoacyl-[acyl-carrier-protein] reductase FabG [Raoultella ornithinolytica]|nr:3-oxoacyl-[acyl-carrier-protein] reductase FabG [Raoultella ornithinolytica]
MQIELTGKKALVTGASRGIGRAIALSLAQAGADVVITYEKSADKAQAVVDEIVALGRRGAAIQADSANAQAIQQAVTRTVETLGGLDILVNNAGIARGGPLESLSLEDIDALINVQYPWRGDRHPGSAAASARWRAHYQYRQLPRQPRRLTGHRGLRHDQICAQLADPRPRSRSRAARHYRKPGASGPYRQRYEPGERGAGRLAASAYCRRTLRSAG